ncbi:MAG: HTH-type transcriptional regulator ImmR [Pelotomaculum sp. PtaB.Bin104]|nr:MAG: HTH-type transcriptional regulator ImmR [Pelotomaculum sp. PtaB.Bin104]
MSVGDRIAQLREELGISQTELANKAGLKPPTISQYESGTRSPSYEAIIKLSNALNITTDYLISGKEIKVGTITDPITKVLLHLLQWFPEEKKKTLLEYAIFLSRDTNLVDFTVLNDAVDYANYVHKKFTNGSLPIDVNQVADKLGVKIIESDLGADIEGMLIKGEQNIILLNSLITYRPRRKFTAAILLGHVIIPWHVKSQYFRKSDSSTLLTNDIEDIEAQQFAAAFIMPRNYIEKDLGKCKVTLDVLKKISSEKYDVSLFVLCNRLADFFKDKYAVIQSRNGQIIKTFPGNRPLKTSLHPQSQAVSFCQDTPVEEETRYSEMPSVNWFEDGKPGETVLEESIFNPDIGKVLTLLTLRTKEEQTIGE